MNWKQLKGGAPFTIDDCSYFHYEIEENNDGGMDRDERYFSLRYRYINPDDLRPRPWEFVAIVSPRIDGLSLYTTTAGVGFTSKVKYSKIKLID